MTYAISNVSLSDRTLDMFDNNPNESEKIYTSKNGIEIFKSTFGKGLAFTGYIGEEMVFVANCQPNTRMRKFGTISYFKLLWRDKDYSNTTGIPQEFILEYFLPKFGKLVSDDSQTQDGFNFWKRLMKEATSKGYNIGYVTTARQEPVYYDKKESLESWIQNNDIYSDDINNMDKLLFISKEPL